MADDKGGNFPGHQVLKAFPPLVRSKALKVGVFHLAYYLHALGVEIVIEAGKLKPRPVNVGSIYPRVFKIP